MSSDGFSWKAFLGSLLVVLAGCIATLLVAIRFLPAHSNEESGQAIVLMIAVIAVGGAAVLTVIARRARRRLLERVHATVRDAAAETAARTSDESLNGFATIAIAVRELRSRLEARLEVSDRQRLTLATLVNQLREGVIVVRPDGRIALLNPAAARLLNLDARGRGEAAFIDQPLERCIPQHDLQALARREHRPTPAESDAGRSRLPPWDAPAADAETRVQVDSPTGSEHLLVHASDLALPESVAAHEPPARLLVLLDITDLTRTMQIKTDFVANASHELRTPLSTIRAAIETLLAMNLREEADAAPRFLQLIDRHSGRLEALVSDLLDLARVESPAARFELKPIELRELLDELHGRVADALQRKQLTWHTELDGCRSARVVASPHLLNLVLDNLVDNAVKFTEPGGHVGVTCRDGPGWVSFEVNDDGCGIPEAEQERVFERFYQVERARSGPERGTGLGLSIVRHAVSAMNGAIALQSQPGKGTRFKVTIPQPA